MILVTNCLFFCLWCLCKSTERADLTKFWSMVDPKGHPRTIEACIFHASIKSSKKQNFNCVFPPLFDFIPITAVVPDTLHCFLRITDILLCKFLATLRRLDNIGQAVTSYDPFKMTNVRKFEIFARSLNIEFDFFVDPGTKALNFTQLPAAQRVKIFNAIKFEHFLSEYKEIESLDFLWNEFLSLYCLMNKLLNDVEISQFAKRAKNWAIAFSSFYLSADITPYVHIPVYHLPEAMRIHGNLGLLSQQSFEQMNNEITQIYFRGTNHGNKAFEQLFKRQYRTT